MQQRTRPQRGFRGHRRLHIDLARVAAARCPGAVVTFDDLR